VTGAGAIPFVCPDCRKPLEDGASAFACRACAKVFPIEAGITDFSGGSYSDVFSPERDVTPELEQCLGDEEAGTRARIADFYLPKLGRLAPPGRPLRVLDCGCGNGLSVDLMTDAGIEAWGNDVSLVRKWQWRERRHPERLLIASGARLPFPDGYFDAVVSCGVLEHVGVIESSGPPYAVRAAPGQRESRVAFLRELLRVVRSPGRLWIDFPNGRHPIDFWHGTGAGGARFHPLDEGFLPSVAETRALLAAADPGSRLRAISPYRRLRFKRVRRRWYGLLLSPAITAFFALMRVPGFRFLAASPMNPFLVVEIEKPGLLRRAPPA
jgi:SAM-dependent methyltransferase